MVLTRSARKAQTQWTRDAVLNNPDLLCYIAEQADLQTACKLLTTSKQNFIGGADWFVPYPSCDCEPDPDTTFDQDSLFDSESEYNLGNMGPEGETDDESESEDEA